MQAVVRFFVTSDLPAWGWGMVWLLLDIFGRGRAGRRMRPCEVGGCFERDMYGM